jgi:L-lysine 6-transaminase
LKTLEEHILMDGFRIVFDFELSRGSYMFDAVTLHRLIDFYGFFGSVPVGYQHPHFDKPEVKEELLRAAMTKIANSDVYSEAYADFVETFTRVAPLPPLSRYLFIEGGALAIENCLKAAMDWKVRKNMAAGLGPARNAAHSVAGGERGTEILHFRHAFHGRSGYTMSLTNTDPRKTDLFAKFDWPRVSTPFIDFSLPEAERENDVIAREKISEQEIMKFIAERGVISAANGCRLCGGSATRTRCF